MNLPKEASIRLVQECKFMRARLSAIREGDAAIDSLADEDVFGRRYPNLLRGDITSLTEAIEASEREFGISVPLPE
jgi:hypothetical protein